MQIRPDTDQGAARQHWRAALSVVLGLACLLLLAFHLTPRQAPWGAVGFDLALAVAGYALTRRMTAGAGGLRDAWGAAIRWGMPALAVVVGIVLAVGLAVLPPDALEREARLAVRTLAGLSGPALMGQGGYDPAVRSELLLHGWILGVAAQLALLWSVVVVRLGERRRLLIGVAVAAAAASALLDLWLTLSGREPYAFWLAPARAWPFLAGALAALTASAAVERLPAPRWLVAFGAMALPVYLWAWPLTALPRVLVARPLTSPELTAVLVAAVGLGAATHLWIERPVRREIGGPTRAGYAAVAVLGGLGFAAAAILGAGGLPGRAAPRLNAEAATLAVPAPFQADCNAEDGRLPPAAPCVSPPGRVAEVVVWGDSHAAHLTPAVRAWAAQRGLAVRQATHSGCPPLLRFSTGFEPRGCAAFNQAALAEWSRTPHAKVIVMGGGWTWALAGADEPRQAPAALEADIAVTLEKVRAALGPETQIVLLGVTPDFSFAPAQCHQQRAFLGMNTFRCDHAAPANAAAARDMDDRLTRIADAETGVMLFRPWTVFCEGALCRTRDPDGPWYLDRTHLTVAGGLEQTALLADVLDHAIAPR